MKLFGLVLGLVLATGIAASAETAVIDIYPGWNLWASPVVPVTPNCATMMGGNFDLMFTAVVTRFDAPTQGMITLDGFSDNDTVFGGILLGEGYYMNNDSVNAITIDGLADGVPDAGGVQTDMWISLPGDQNDGIDQGGWHMIGNPFNHAVLLDDGSLTGSRITFTDGVDLKTWDEAVVANWVADAAFAFDTVTGSQSTAGYFFADDDHFRAGKGYWFQTKKDNLAMIIPGNTTD